MLSRVILIGVASGYLFQLMGCTPLSSIDPSGVLSRSSPPLYVEGVPFYPQVQYQCGPASLAALLNFWGQEVMPEEIAEAIHLPRFKGSLSMDLWRYAIAQGLDARMEEGSLAYLQTHLRDKEPVIAFLNLGFRFFPVGHFLVVVGLDPLKGAVITYSGTEKDKTIPYQKFFSAWEKTGYWSLRIIPKDQA